MITAEEYLFFAGRALDAMAEILTALGDEAANARPDLAGANSPYVIVTHSLGVVGYWAGRLVAGRPVERDRDAEFTASGPVSDLVARVAVAKAQFEADVAAADFRAPLRHQPPASFQAPLEEMSQGAALLHVYEELAQHLGQLELTRDLVARQPAS